MGMTLEVIRQAGPVCQVSVHRPQVVVNRIGAPGRNGDDGEPGSAGNDGADGKSLLHGSGPPSDSLGLDDWFYIDTAANVLYGPKAGGLWGVGVSLVGPRGLKGDPGQTGSFAGTSSDDLPEGTSHRYYTAEREAAVATAIAAKANAPIRSVLTSNGVYAGSNGVYNIYVGLDVEFATTGLYLIRSKILNKLAVVSTLIQSRFETSAGLLLGGVTGDPCGIALNNVAPLTQTLTTGSPSVINGATRSNNVLANVLYAEFIINVTTVGTLRTCMSCSTVTAGMLTVWAGSYIEAIKLN